MKKTALVVIVSLICGFAVARYVTSANYDDAGTKTVSDQQYSDQASPLAARVRQLEQTVSEERQARQLLQEELVYLTEELESLRADRGDAFAAPAESAPEAAAASYREAARQRFASRNDPANRVQRLVDAGFSPDRAESIVQRESQLRMDVIEARYEAQRSGDLEALEESRYSQTDMFREELGPAEYERYLEATGRSTSVVIGGVIGTSPAQRAGLQPGDSIINYDGHRVYNMTDLNRATHDGEVGQTVVVEVIRDGASMQVALPRGPLGVTRAARRR